jgi:hypothetical protein
MGRRMGHGIDDETGGIPADDSVPVECPYCGAPVELVLDPGGLEPPGQVQEYVEDCEVCCRPWQVRVSRDPSGGVVVEVRTDDE